MNEYTIKDLSEGKTESFSVTVTEEMMSRFFEITDDSNPLHRDSDFAKNRQGFKDKVVYGMLTASFLSTLAGVYLPGKYSLIQDVKTSFSKPVYVGDRLTVSGEVAFVHEALNNFDMKVSVVNQNGEQVLRGKMTVGFLKADEAN